MEIRGPQPNKPADTQGGQPVGPAQPATSAEKAAFKEAMGAAGAAAGAGAAGQSPIIALRPNFERLSSRIKQGLAKGENKQQILQGVISEQLAEQFGSGATPPMTAAVTEKFQNDPQLSQMFNRLYAQATK